MSEEGLRVRDDLTSFYSFLDEILVVCPRCCRGARTFRWPPSSRDLFAPRRLTCSCGYSSDWSERSIAWNWHVPTDGYFRLSLWLQIPVRGRILWALNGRHLGAMERIVHATLRERARNTPRGYRGTMLTTLPSWMKEARSRQSVLRAVSLLRCKLSTLT
jgi:hypothetical protein